MRKRQYAILGIIPFICVSFFSTANAEQVYKSVDIQGNVAYSDQASPHAQSVSLPPLSTISTPTTSSLTSMTNTSPTSHSKGYTTLDLISPINDQTIWNNSGNVNVKIALSPQLEAGDTIEVILDGKTNAFSDKNKNFSLTSLDRGTHVLQVQIIDNTKKTIKVSNVVTFYLHKAIVNSP